MPETPPLRPGFVVLHGNRIEDLAAVALDWLARHPLGPLDEETLLVPSSGMAEWLKAAMAERLGVAAGFRIELPAQFGWRAWRAVLGAAAVPAASPLDKGPLTWWLMRRLPELARQPAFAPLDGFLSVDPSPLRRLELARRLADLFDQYQVYRPDWLDDWAAGRDQLRHQAGEPAAAPLPAGQAWQAALWRALLAELAEADRPAAAPRPALHRRFIQALRTRPEASPPPGLPPRLLLFGTTHLPHTTLEALGELSRHIPVLLAVPDPSSHPWAQLPPDDPTGHPLLQAWGRQGRDFLRQLAAWDSGRERAEQLGLVRTELFDESPAHSVLQQLQARLRDLSPAPEQPLPWPAGDRSLVFHQAHGPLREVEILHDQLLDAFARGEFEPRDVVVMVPDIERFAPAIAAVFGRFAPGEPRHIPWGLADRRERGRHPLLRTLEALLQVRDRRWTHSELHDWLATPAVATRWGLDEADIAQLGTWLAGAGLRWGLHGAQRAALGLQAAGAVGTLRFALDRLLLGYATGVLPPEAGPLGEGADAGAGLDPWPEVAGVDAALAGTLAEALARLDAWWAEAAEPRSPTAWLPLLRALLTAMFSASDDRERSLLAQLDEALRAWVATCEAAGFAEPVGLDLVREAWLTGVDEAGGGRFRAGGVTFCTLLPLRAIPFRCVCLLGMNDGDYPRPASRSDFDLMAEPALARPGDRSRRDDDRQLMLDALLAARQRLHISWSAHRARDNQAQPPSVLVQQLREHVAALWGADALQAATVAHPLQPFSRAYLEEAGDPRLFSFAHEWRSLHEPAPAVAAQPAIPALRALPAVLPLKRLADFVRRPVEAFFRQRLRTDLRLQDDTLDDDEPFTAGGLQGWQWRDEILHLRPGDPAAAAAQLQQRVARLRREGRLPWGGPGEAVAQALRAEMAPVLAAWAGWQARHAEPADPAPVGVDLPPPGLAAALRVEAGLLPWRLDEQGHGQLLRVSAGRVTVGKAQRKPRPDQLVGPWLDQLALGASGRPCGLQVIGPDGIVHAAPVAEAEARGLLANLAAAWCEGTGEGGPWPTALATGLAWLPGRDAHAARAAYDSASQRRGDDQEPHLARLYPRFADLLADPRFESATEGLYAPMAAWLATLRVEPLPDAVALADPDAETADD